MTLKFYQNLGKLFYAIAASDKNVRTEEFLTLKKIVKKYWLDIDSIEDNYSSDAAFQIEIVFDWLNTQENLSSKLCFDDFVDYKNRQNHLFTDEVKNLILKTASAIATAFSGVNKSELIMLAKLEMDLNTI